MPNRLTSLLVGGRDRRRNPPSCREITYHRHSLRCTDRDEIVEDLVGHRFIENAAVAEVDHVVLERLQLDAALAGNVGDADLAEVGQAGFRANGSELRTTDGDFVIASWTRVRERLYRPALLACC